MRIIAMTNEGQLPMMKNMLNSAVKAGFPMELFHCYILDSNKETASYNTQEFQTITKRKLEIILENMNLDSEVMWIDNDIVLFENMIQNVRKYPGNFVMQDDLWGVCTGFFLVRSGTYSKRLIQSSIESIEKSKNSNQNDQHAFNNEYNKFKRTSFGFYISKLPQDQYPNGHVYFVENRKSNAKMLHCNYLETTSEKVQRFKDFNLWDDSDIGFNLVNKHFI